MDEYIKRSDVIAAILNVPRGNWSNERYSASVKAIPAADVVPVRHGKWEITDAYPHNVHCSVCHKRFAQTHWEVWEDGSLPRDYCPNCGAKMDGEA